MTEEKLKSEMQTLVKFFNIYCIDNHQNQHKEAYDVSFKNQHLETLDVNLCEDCLNLLNYAYEKLQVCHHEVKPRCRSCHTPCYEKPQWKNMAKMMRYSGIKLGLSKLKKFFKK